MAMIPCCHHYGANKVKCKKDIERGNGFDGIGKPEPLRGNLSGFWSRRIDDANRLVYRVKDGVLEIVSCKGHYDD